MSNAFHAAQPAFHAAPPALKPKAARKHGDAVQPKAARKHGNAAQPALKPKAARKRNAAKSGSNMWSCFLCTYDNDNTSDQCYICLHPRGFRNDTPTVEDFHHQEHAIAVQQHQDAPQDAPQYGAAIFRLGAEVALLGAKQSASRVDDLQSQLFESKITAAIDRTVAEGRRYLHDTEKQYQIMLKEQKDKFKLFQQKAASLDKQKTAKIAALKSDNVTLKAELAALKAELAALKAAHP